MGGGWGGKLMENHQKSSTNDENHVEVVSKLYISWGHFWKINLFDSAGDETLAFKEIRGPIWRSEDQLGGIL